MAELGRIIPVKAYQTTDGQKFTGDMAQERAYAHQERLNQEKKEWEACRIPQEFIAAFKARGSTIIRYGVTEITINIKESTIKVYHGGNMGSSLKKDVIPNVEKLFGKGAFRKMREKSKNTKIDGSPDYMYTKIFYF
jgi:hypothetical protein